MRAYLVEPAPGRLLWGEVRSREIAEITRLIQEKHPEVIVAKSRYYPGTEIINILVIHVPETLTREKIEKDFSCTLIEVAYEPKSS